MPLLTRVVGTPLTIDIGTGTVAGLAPLLADRRISSGGHVAVVVGPGLGEEEMKVHVTEAGLLDHINKAIDPATAQGEYIGVTLIEPHAAGPLAGALQATFERDPQLYYEDGYQTYVDAGGEIAVAPIGDVAWVEVDDHADLARAREIACHY